MNYQTVPSRRIPLLVRGGCGFNKKLRSRRSRRRPGWSLTSKCFKTHSETSLASDHPVRAFAERDHFLMARPPLLCKEGNMPPEFIHSFYTVAKETGLVSIFLLHATDHYRNASEHAMGFIPPKSRIDKRGTG